MGMRNISPNDLRRTFASWLKQAGVDSMVVAKLLGHTTSRMVELVYGHLNDATTRAAITKLWPPPRPAPTLKLAREMPQRQRRSRLCRAGGVAADGASRGRGAVVNG
jgi:hypothetical protein